MNEFQTSRNGDRARKYDEFGYGAGIWSRRFKRTASAPKDSVWRSIIELALQIDTLIDALAQGGVPEIGFQQCLERICEVPDLAFVCPVDGQWSCPPLP